MEGLESPPSNQKAQMYFDDDSNGENAEDMLNC